MYKHVSNLALADAQTDNFTTQATPVYVFTGENMFVHTRNACTSPQVMNRVSGVP